MDNKKSFIAKLWLNKYYRDAFIKYSMKHYDVKNYKRTFDDLVSKIESTTAKNLDDVSLVKIIIYELSAFDRCDNDIRSSERGNIVIKFIDKPIKNYLDYGCGNGSITKYIGDCLDIDNIYGVDVIDQKIKGVNYLIGDISGIPTESIDLVTAFVSFHHICDINHIISEINRVTKTGGILVIREHDFDVVGYHKIQLKNYLHSIHIFNDVMHTGNCDVAKLNVETTYKSSTEWNKLLRDHGFILKSELRYPGNNPQKLYYAGYVKI